MLSFDQISPKLECGVDEYRRYPFVGTKHIKANGKRVFGSVYSMVLSTWNSEYALQWQCRKTMFLLCETSNAFIGAFCYSKIHFHSSGPLKSIKTMLKSLHVLLGLSPVWNCYTKGGYLAFNNRV